VLLIPLAVKHTLELIYELGNIFISVNDQRRIVCRQMILTSSPSFHGENQIHSIYDHVETPSEPVITNLPSILSIQLSRIFAICLSDYRFLPLLFSKIYNGLGENERALYIDCEPYVWTIHRDSVMEMAFEGIQILFRGSFGCKDRRWLHAVT